MSIAVQDITPPEQLPVPRKDIYMNDYSSAVIAHHGARKVADSAAYLLQPLEEAYGNRSAAQLKFLDVGCGPGSITLDFAQNYYPNSHFTGIDYTSRPISQAREAAKDIGIHNVEFGVGDVLDLQFPDNTFDVVYCSQVLMRVIDPVKAMAEMNRVCKAGGVIGAKESSQAQWYPDLPGLSMKWDLHHKVSRVTGGNPFCGHHIHAWARKAGVPRDQMTCSVDSWLFTTKEQREWWGGIWAKRYDPDGGSRFVKTALKTGTATRGQLELVVRDFNRWIEDEDGWYTILHGNVVIRKE